MKNFQVLRRNADNTIQVEYNTIAEISVGIPVVNGAEIRGAELTTFLNDLVSSTNKAVASTDIDGTLSQSLGID